MGPLQLPRVNFDYPKIPLWSYFPSNLFRSEFIVCQYGKHNFGSPALMPTRLVNAGKILWKKRTWFGVPSTFPQFRKHKKENGAREIAPFSPDRERVKVSFHLQSYLPSSACVYSIKTNYDVVINVGPPELFYFHQLHRYQVRNNFVVNRFIR